MRWVGVIGVILVSAAVAAGGIVISKATDEGTVQRVVLEGSESPSGLVLDDNGSEVAPNFGGVDVLTGDQVELNDFAGKPVVINVWASGCPDCGEHARELLIFARDHPEAEILGLDIDDDASIATELGVDALPATLFLNAEHVIVARLTGTGDRERFERGLQEALVDG